MEGLGISWDVKLENEKGNGNSFHNIGSRVQGFKVQS